MHNSRHKEFPPGPCRPQGALLLSACKLELRRGAAATKIADIPLFFLLGLFSDI